ncbi:hypothetical protein K474DRAFT_1776417 [Panus rudis PR-1116 ss-1]|nr:hypothetical protein K474DRAFT_1776417 [Panus rudis PR-1116 ss-1]
MSDFLMHTTTVHLPHHYCRLRFLRRNAFTRYKVYEIAASLSCVLQCALTFFLIGLAYFLWDLHTTVFRVVLLPLIVWLALYVAAIVLSTMDPACPYTIPMIGNLYQFIHLQILRINSLVYCRFLGRQAYQYIPQTSPYSFEHTALADPEYDALVLVSAFSTFRTKDMSEQVVKAFRTVHLGKIHEMEFLKYLFIPSNNVQATAALQSFLQPAVKAILTTLFPSMTQIQPIGIQGYVNAIMFTLDSTNVGRSRMAHILGNICGLRDEHLSSELVEHVWEAVAPCFDFYKKKRWTIATNSARVIDVFTKFLSLHLSNAPDCYRNFVASPTYADDLAPNWLGGYLFLLVHSRRHLDAESLERAHGVLIKFSDLLQHVIDRYGERFTEEAITRAQLCIELAEEFQAKYSTAIDPALLTGVKHIASIKKPYVPQAIEMQYYWMQPGWQESTCALRESLKKESDQTTQNDTPAVDLAEVKDEENPVQSSMGSDTDTSTLPVKKDD